MRPDHSTLANGSDFAFAALILARLRDGRRPGPRALERAPLIEHWAIAMRDEIFELTGIAWRLPLCRSLFAAPLFAIDPAGGWARTVDEWVVIGDPQSAGAIDGMVRDEVTRRATIWLRRQMSARRPDRATATFAARLPAVAVL